MKYAKLTDISLNVLLPLLAGCLLYIYTGNRYESLVTNNHLSDGLWAYAYISAILITWNRKIHLPWIITIFLSAIAFEFMQYRQWVPGTGDIWDVVTYFIFMACAIKSNQFFTQYLKPKKDHYENSQ
jgi:hypothetical protein